METTFKIILNLFSVLGGIVATRAIYMWILPLQRISWKKVEKGVKSLKEDLINENYYPTLIVGIGRGGSIIGALLSGTLGNVPILVIDRVYEWTNKERKEEFCEEIHVSKNIEKVLLVAGELHTGKTAKKYTEYFNSMGAKEIKMVAFMQNPYPIYKPDFSYIVTEKTKIRLPWMLTKNYLHQSIECRDAKQHNLPNI